MNKILSLVVFIIFFGASSDASVVKSTMLDSLPDHGRHSCYFANFNTTRADEAILCSATIVSQTQVMLEDSHCWQHVQRRAPRSKSLGNKTQLVCNGGQIKYDFNGRPSARKSGGLILAQLPQPIPYAAPALSEDSQRTQRLITAGQCMVKTATTQGRLGDEFRLVGNEKIRHIQQGVNPHFAGGQLICDDDGEQVIIAILGAEGELHFVDKNKALLNIIDHQKYQTKELTLEERADLLCRETEQCLSQVSPAAVDLSSDMINVIKALHQDLKEKEDNAQRSKEREDALEQLMSIWREILIKCQDAIWKDRRSGDSSAETGYFSGVSGTFERLSISVAEVFSDEFLLNQFKDVELFSENLTEAQMKDVLKKLEPQMKGLNNVQRVAKAAEGLAFEVVRKFLLELNPDMTPQEQQDWINVHAADFSTCLKAAKNSAMVTECGDKFGQTIPALIALTELERQTQKNFLSLYQDAQGAVKLNEYNNLKNETKLTFQRCIQNHYYSNQSSPAPERARACVYEGLLAGYHLTARAQIKENFEKSMGDSAGVEQMVQAALGVAQGCDYGPLIHRSGRMSAADYQMLSKLSVQEFQSKLEECSQSLTENVGGLVITQTVLNNPEVQNNFDSAAALNLSQQVIDQYYRPCMEQQKSAGRKADPRQCEGLITELTTLQVAKTLMAPALSRQLEGLGALNANETLRHRNAILSEVEEKIQQCHDQLKAEYLDLIKDGEKSQPDNVEKRTLQCVNEGVKIMSSRLTTLKVQETFKNDPSLNLYGEKILRRPDIIALSDLTAECFSREIEKLEAVTELSDALDPISAKCALDTEKEATLIAMGVILEERLKTNIPDAKERQNFIGLAMQENQGLKELILKASSADELKQTVASIPALVTLRFAQTSIPKTVAKHLEDKATPARIQSLSESLVNHLSVCIKEFPAPTEQQLSACINKTSAFGNLEILKELVVHTAKENLQNQEALAARLAQDSQQRLKACLDKISVEMNNTLYDKELEKCMVVEVSLISRDIPREAILGMTPLLSTRHSPAQLRAQLLEVDKFYLQTGNLNGVDETDPAVSIYMSLNSCLVRARSEIRTRSANVTDAQKEYETCTGEVEGMIKNMIRRNFVNKDYPGKTRDHHSVLDSAATILLELTGKQAPRAPGAKVEDPSDVTKTQDLLDTIGQSTVVACNYNRRGCEEALAQTRRQVLQYKERNPEATSKELEQLFINSPFIDLIIEANVSQAMSTQLSANLQEFADAGGILQRKIADITSPAVLNPIMENRYGRAAKALVRQSIIDGANTEDVINNPALKAALGMALTQDIGMNSFSDQLLHGLVQPVLIQQKRTSNNPTGIFTNTKVTFGRFFGVVKGRDFDWDRIRQTPQGEEARRIFAQEILQPVLEGRDITRVPAGSNSRKSQQDQAMERIEKLIQDGIKHLSK